jgi:putative alpha-1,2-mannosidase
MTLGEGKTLEISQAGGGVYVHAVRVNGTAHASSWIELSQLSRPQNRIRFELQNQPDREWATKQADLPPWFDLEKP